MKSAAAACAVYCVGSDPVIRFAAEEAARYLKRMTGKAVRVSGASRVREGESGVWLDLAKPADRDARVDRVSVRGGGGRVVLSGSNPRSVLFAVYRWLEMLGCRWFRPGREGERVPRVGQPLAVSVRIREAASHRHRCICIEGSCSEQHVLHMLDYAAKRGFNAYFLQFRNSYTFFERWYGLEKNRAPRKTPFSVAQAEAIHAAVKRAALQRGLILHMVGHGWTCEPFGIAGTEWKATQQKIPASARQYFAEVKGKRELWGGIPLNTQLCYSNPNVRTIMAREVADYAARHRDEQVIHVWLADGCNNFCECASCRKDRHSDLYVRLMNEIDRRLTARRVKTRIVFLAYVDLLWAPVKEKIRNPDRFILMFAPITRSYTLPFAAGRRGEPERIAPYRVNELKFPASPAANLKLFRGWRRAFPGERVDFDYHLWRAWLSDPGQMEQGRILYEDVRSLKQLGMDGFISCQAQRVSFPTGWSMHVLGKTLWDRRVDYGRMAETYFRDLYGADGRRVLRYLEALSRLLVPSYMRLERQTPARTRMVLRQWTKIPAVVRRMRPVIRRGCASRDPVTRRAWVLLQLHAWYVVEWVNLHALAARKDRRATAAYRRFAEGIDQRLPQLDDVLDTWMAKGLAQHALAMAKIPFEEHIVVE